MLSFYAADCDKSVLTVTDDNETSTASENEYRGRQTGGCRDFCQVL